MFKLKQNTHTYGDCTAGYAVHLDKKYTVKEFIDAVLTQKEWGYIGIKKQGTIFGEPKCEYKKDTLIGNFPKEILNKTVVKVKASGGWSRMDYELQLKENEPEKVYFETRTIQMKMAFCPICHQRIREVTNPDLRSIMTWHCDNCNYSQ